MSLIRDNDPHCQGWYIITTDGPNKTVGVQVVHAREGFHSIAEWRRLTEAVDEALAQAEAYQAEADTPRA